MNMTTCETEKNGRLHDLPKILQTEIRGQNQVLPRVVSVVRRGELGLTKPGRPRGSFLLLGPTGVGKTEIVVVTTKKIFGPEKLFRLDMSEFQTQESLGLLLGAKSGEIGYLGAMRERAAEGSLLFDEGEKAHPRVLDILLQEVIGCVLSVVGYSFESAARVQKAISCGVASDGVRALLEVEVIA